MLAHRGDHVRWSAFVRQNNKASVGTYASDLAKQFDILPPRGLLAGQDLVETFFLRQDERRRVVRYVLDRPYFRLEGVPQPFLKLRISSHQECGANRDGPH